MAERKVLVKYYPPDFNPERLIRNPKQTEKQENVRMMLPFSLKCYTCGHYLYIGTKFNMRKETSDEDYLGIPVLRFYMKCTYCYSEITFKTDPKNHDYVCEHGGARNYEAWRDARAAEEKLQEMREQEEKGNAMKFLENRTKDSRREMDILDALDEIKNISRQNAKVTPEQMFDYLAKRDHIALNDADEEIMKEKFRQKRMLVETKADQEEKEEEYPLFENPFAPTQPVISSPEQPKDHLNLQLGSMIRLKKKPVQEDNQVPKTLNSTSQQAPVVKAAFLDYSDDDEEDKEDGQSSADA